MRSRNGGFMWIKYHMDGGMNIHKRYLFWREGDRWSMAIPQDLDFLQDPEDVQD